VRDGRGGGLSRDRCPSGLREINKLIQESRKGVRRLPRRRGLISSNRRGLSRRLLSRRKIIASCCDGQWDISKFNGKSLSENNRREQGGKLTGGNVPCCPLKVMKGFLIVWRERARFRLNQEGVDVVWEARG